MTTFNLLSAVAIDYQTVDLTFSAQAAAEGVSIVAATYSFNHGLTAVAALNPGPSSLNSIRVYTQHQIDGVVYTVTVAQTLQDMSGDSLVINQATFTGIGFPATYAVSALEARSDCIGLSIFLKWTNPTTYGGSPSTPSHMKIVRRLRQWPFDLTDSGYDVLWDSSTIIDTFEDTGVAWPITTLTAATVTGTQTVQVASSTGYTIGDLLKVETVEGPRTSETVKIQSIPSGTSIMFATPLQNAYPVGARIAESTPLQPQTFYYYLVLVLNPSTGNYDVLDDSKAFALSVDLYNAASWFQNNTPKVNLERDALAVAQGGGGGFLQKWFDVMGCWLNLMRGMANSVQLLNNPDKTPFNALTAQNEALGIQPEGFSYDYDIVRRPLTSLVFIYHSKGTCPAIVETVSMFTKWTATCVEFGDHACDNGAGNLTIWDGTSQRLDVFSPAYTGVWSFIEKTSAGDGILTDTSQTFTAGQWDDGEVIGSLGDIACLNAFVSATQLSTQVPKTLTTLTSPATTGATVLHVQTTAGLRPGLMIQLSSNALFNPGAEIHQITAVSPSGHTITLEPFGIVSATTYPTGSIISIQKSVIRPELGYGKWSTTAALQVITFPGASWVNNQWINHKLLTSDNVKHNIVSNTTNTVTVDGAAPPASGLASIAWDFTLGGSYAARSPTVRYSLYNGIHTRFWEPTFDLFERGTLYDPNNPLWVGPGLNLYGVYGPADVGVYIQGNIPVIQGQASTVQSGSVFTLDMTQPAPIAGALKGMYLNPNQNQEQLFLILDNSTTTVTVAGDVSTITIPGQYYYVLTPRDKNRFQRLTQRLRQEFTDTDVKVHVLFV